MADRPVIRRVEKVEKGVGFWLAMVVWGCIAAILVSLTIAICVTIIARAL
jgi:hypothetical protein